MGIAQAHELRPQIRSSRALARAVGVNQDTVRHWLQLTPPDPATIAALVAAAGLTPPLASPPMPWKDWDEVRRVREDLRLYRTLFLHRPERLTCEETQTLAGLLAGPVGAMLRVARTFLEGWFAIWQDDTGKRRTPSDEQRYRIWQDDAESAAVAHSAGSNSIWTSTTSNG